MVEGFKEFCWDLEVLKLIGLVRVSRARLGMVSILISRGIVGLVRIFMKAIFYDVSGSVGTEIKDQRCWLLVPELLEFVRWSALVIFSEAAKCVSFDSIL